MLTAKAQKILKGLHETFVILLVGGLLCIAGLRLVEQTAPPRALPIDLSTFHLFNWIVYYASLGVLLTGLAFSLFTRWGFAQHYWIALKWIAVVVMFVLAWTLLGPALSGAVSLADAGMHTAAADGEYQGYATQGLLVSLILGGMGVAIVFISTIKPWGRRHHRVLPFWLTKRPVVLSVAGLLVVTGLSLLIMGKIALQQYRGLEIAETDLSRIEDGGYAGEAVFGGFSYRVAVSVVAHRITRIEVLHNRTSAYARFAEGVVPRILAAQSAKVDAITGATTTSKALLKAVENALAPPSP